MSGMRFSSGTRWPENRFFTNESSGHRGGDSLAVSNRCDCVDIDAADHRPGDDRRSYTEPGRDAAANSDSDAGSYSHAGSKPKSSANGDPGPDAERDSFFAGAGSFRDSDQLRPDWRRT